MPVGFTVVSKSARHHALNDLIAHSFASADIPVMCLSVRLVLQQNMPLLEKEQKIC